MGDMQNPATSDLDLAGFRARAAAPSNLPADYVTRGELEGLLQAVTALVALRIDGTNQMLAPLRMGSQRLTELLAGMADTDGVTVAQLAERADAARDAAKTYADTLIAQGQRFPINVWSRTVTGVYTFTVGVDCPDWVTAIYAGLAGGGAGAGGSKPPSLFTNIYTKVRYVSKKVTIPTVTMTGRNLLVKEQWVPGGWGGDGARLVRKLTVAAGDVLQIEVGGFGTGGAGGGSTGNPAKDHGGGGGGGGGTKLTHAGVDYIAGGGGGGGGAKAGNYTGYGDRGGDGGPVMTDGEARTGSAGGDGATVGTALHGGLAGRGGNHDGWTDVAGEHGGDGATSHADDPFAFLFGDLTTLGLGGEPNVTSTGDGATGNQGLPGAAILRW